MCRPGTLGSATAPNATGQSRVTDLPPGRIAAVMFYGLTTRPYSARYSLDVSDAGLRGTHSATQKDVGDDVISRAVRPERRAS